MPAHTGVRQETVELLLDHRITFAGPRFQAQAIEHLDAATTIFDQPSVLQIAGRLGHAFTAHAQHVGDQLLRHHQLVTDQAIQAQQQPAAQLLVERMVPPAEGRDL